ncbi:MAG: DUF2784 domain-containing protein [Actinomycetes bacterium]
MAALVLADAVVVVHLAFLVYMVLGGFLALRRYALVWPRIATTLYSAYVTLASFTCPLTTLEKWLLTSGGERPYDGSFIHRYLQGVLYPADYETAMWLGCMTIAVASQAYVLARHRRQAVPVQDSLLPS